MPPEPSKAPAGAIHALDHVVVAVADLEEATRSYARLLGRSPSWRGEHPGSGSANALFRLENTYLELLAPAGDGPIGSLLTRRLEEGEGLFALAFGTDDADACHQRFAAAGLEPAPVQKGMGRDTGSGAFREWRNVMLPPTQTRGVPLFAIEHRSPAELLPRVDAVGKPGAAPSGLDHVVVFSSDGDASRALYENQLGLRLALDRSFEKYGFRGLFFRVGGVTVEVSAPADPGGQQGDRMWGLAWQVGDVAAAQDRLRAEGCDVSEVRTGRKPGTVVCTVRAPTHGVPTLLIGPGA